MGDPPLEAVSCMCILHVAPAGARARCSTCIIGLVAVSEDPVGSFARWRHADGNIRHARIHELPVVVLDNWRAQAMVLGV